MSEHETRIRMYVEPVRIVNTYLKVERDEENGTVIFTAKDIRGKSTAYLLDGKAPIDDGAGIGDTKKLWSADKNERVRQQMMSTISDVEALTRVSSLDQTAFAKGTVIETVGIPVYVSDVTGYAAYGITEKGWYVFARIAAPEGASVTEQTTVIGAAGSIAAAGDDHVDVAVRFNTMAQSVPVVIQWGDATDTFIFKSSDLAVRNLDYRVTFYVYDISGFVTWSYALTTDTAFDAKKKYYTYDEGTGEYTPAEVTAGESVPADTYYNHSKLHIEGMPANVTYRLDETVDCPIEIALPEIAEDGHGAWFEIQMRYNGSYSCTLLPVEGIKIGTAQTQAQGEGINTIDLQYTDVDDVKMWTLLNTHSNIPA